MYCLPQHLHDIKCITFLEVHFKMPLTLNLRLVAKQVNSVEATKKLVQVSHLLWHFSEELVLIMNSVILTINLRSVVKNIKTNSLLEITNPGK